MINPNTLRMVRKIIPNQEPVTLGVRTSGAEGTFTSYALPFAKRWEVDGGEKEIHGLLNVQSLGWDVWQEALDAATLAGVEAQAPAPVPHGVVTDADGVSWLIVSVKKKLMGNIYPCVCKKMIAQQKV